MARRGQPDDRPKLSPEESRWIKGLFEGESDGLFRFARSLPGTNSVDAEDFVQTTFHELVRAWGKVGGLGRDEQRKWLHRVLRNKAIDEWRRTRVVDTTPDVPEPVGQPVDLADRVGWSIALARCWEAIERMPLTRQRVAFLRWHEGWTTARVADHLGVAESTVRGHLREARLRLRADLGHLVPFIEDDEGGGVADGRR